ncbi:MAG TPA: hypothetical protein PK228_18165, partial [Saprospiraceae bacterium]|nr:hypothetical protein [Saprospiraceae bacterium]
MKKTLLLAALFLVLGGGAWYALNKKSETGSRNSPDMDFAVPNTGDIYKIFLADRKGQTATLERKEGYWLYNGKARARPSAINILLETIAKVNVWYVPPKANEKSMIRSLAAEGIKVELYDKGGKLMKSYYVGGVTNDEHGTYMIMEGAEQPYIVHVPSFVGQLRVRYLLGDDEWTDRMIFLEKPEEIQSVSVEYPQRKSDSFRLEKIAEAEYSVKPFFSTTPASKQPLRKGVPEAYLLAFENLGAEGFETDNPLRDSITNLVPFAIVTLKKVNGEEKQVRFWPVEVQQTREGMPYVHRYFAEVNKSAFMLIQEGVFGPIFRGYRFFYESAPGEK